MVTEGTEEHRRLIIEKADYEYQLKYFQKKLTKDFIERRNLAIREIIEEITREIERYARGHELDLVLEK